MFGCIVVTWMRHSFSVDSEREDGLMRKVSGSACFAHMIQSWMRDEESDSADFFLYIFLYSQKELWMLTGNYGME
jgi:hypothetical protein